MDEILERGAGDGAPAEQAGVADEPVAEQPVSESTDQETPTVDVQEQPEPSQEERRKLDLTELPEFREWQRRYDQRMAEYQQRMEEMRRQLEEQQLAGMDDYEKLEFRLRKAEEEKEMIRQQYELQLAEMYKQQGLREISQRYGVPMDVLDDSSPEAAEASALKYLLKQMKEQQEKQRSQEAAARNSVDVGGGSSGVKARLEAEYRKAIQENDAMALLRIKEEAAAEGIDL